MKTRMSITNYLVIISLLLGYSRPSVREVNNACDDEWWDCFQLYTVLQCHVALGTGRMLLGMEIVMSSKFLWVYLQLHLLQHK